MHIKRIAEFADYSSEAEVLVDLVNSTTDTFNETITIKNDGTWGFYTRDIKLTVIKEANGLVRLIYEGPKLNSVITEKLKASGLRDEHIVELLVIQLPNELKDAGDAYIVRDEFDFELLKMYNPVFMHSGKEIKQFPCIIADIKVECYDFHPLNGLTLSQSIEKMEAKKKALQEVVEQIENEKDLYEAAATCYNQGSIK